MTGPTPTDPHESRDATHRRRRPFRAIFRWSVRALVALAILLIIAIILATQTSIVGGRLLPQIGAAVNLDVRADSAYIGWKGQYILKGARFRLPTIDGPAGEVLAVETVRADIDWWASLGGEPRIRMIRLFQPVLIASQSLDDRSLNIGHLQLPRSAPGGSAQLPTIIATDARIELGEHLGTQYTVLKTINIDGRFAPSPDASPDKPAYDLTLIQLQEGERSAARAPPPPTTPTEASSETAGFRVSGTYSDERIALTLENFSLDNWPAESVPSPVRALFRDLFLQGNVPRATFTYTDADGITARLDLRGVAMNLPLEPDFGPPPPGAPVLYGPPARFMRLYDTDGTITFARDSVLAQVNGRLEDMPYRVTWFHQGITQNAAFTCDIVSDNFRIEASPALLPYAPHVVAERLQDFSSPTATVTARMTIQRGPPVEDRPGLITVNGSVDLRDGVAAFEGFPYQFRNITGTFRFNSNQIEFRNVTGRSPSGASVVASGLIAPLDEDAQVDVLVEMSGAPIDDAMIQSFGPRHRDLIPALFNQDRYEALRAAGLIRAQADAEREDSELRQLRESARTGVSTGPEATERIRHLERRAAVPTFDLGGLTDVTVNVHRPYGFETDWQTTVDIRMPRVGMLTKVFPLPVIGRDVTVHIEDNDGRLTGGAFSALGGGTADVAATFTVPLAGDEPTRTEIAIEAKAIPLTPILISALPGDDDGEHKRMLRALNIGAVASGTVRIAGRPAPSGEMQPEGVEPREEDLGFDADFQIEGGTLTPDAADPSLALALTGLNARLQMNENRLLVDFTATPPGGTDPEPEHNRAIFGQVRADFHSWGEDAKATYSASLHWPDLSLETPVETLVEALSPAAAGKIVEARREFRPTGLLSAHVGVKSLPGGPSVEVSLDEIQNASLDVLGRRVELREAIGAIGIVASAATDGPEDGPGEEGGPAPAAIFDNFQAEFHVEGERAGTLQLDGSWPLDTVAERSQSTSDALRIALRRAPIESTFLRSLLEEHLAPETFARIAEFNPRGSADAHTTIRPGPDGPVWDVLRIEPRAMAMNAGGTELAFGEVSGAIDIEPTGSGIIRALNAAATEWSFSADAAWSTRRGDDLSVRSEFRLAGRRLAPDLLAILPKEVRALFDDLAFDIGGPFEIDDGRLDFTRTSSGSISDIDFAGNARFRDALLEIGFPLSEVTGLAEARFTRAGIDAAPVFNLDVRADSLSAAGITMTDAIANISSGKRAGEILIRSAAADVHEGRLSAEVTIAPPQSPLAPFANVPIFGPPAPDRRAFTAMIQLGGVRFSPLLDELAVVPDPPMDSPAVLPPDPDESPIGDRLAGVGATSTDSPEAGDLSRGALDAQVSLSGIIGDPRTRRGHGSLRIAGGRVLNLPVVLALIEVSNLALPVNASLDYAAADFFLDGELVVFNDLSVHSSALHIFGSGTMTWPERLLDLRFDSRSARPIPLLSSLLQGIRSELVTTTVRGRLGEHEVRLRQLSRSRRILGGAVRQIPVLAPEEPDEIQRRSQEGRQRGGDFGPGIPPSRPARGVSGGPGEPVSRDAARPN